jgi:conjugative transfer signal peptidase TraF
MRVGARETVDHPLDVGRAMGTARRLGVVAVAIIIPVIASNSGFHANFTRSLPMGLYRTTAGEPTRGDLVLACLPESVAAIARTRGYVWRGLCAGEAAPIGKVVLAVGGDVVVLDDSGFSVNGERIRRSRLLEHDSKGRAIPHYPFGSYRTRADEVWLFSPYHRASFDSRYFGPIRIREVRARMAPFVVIT